MDLCQSMGMMSVIKQLTDNMYIIMILMSLTNARPRTSQDSNNDLYHPEDRDRDDWLTCNGMPCKDWYRVQRLMTELNLMDLNKGENPSKTVGPLSNLFGDMQGIAPASHDELARPWEGTDILLSLDQAENIYRNAIQRHSWGARKTRPKRKINRDKNNRWDFPIPFKFDGSHNSQEKTLIKKAIANWENETCVKFHEVDYRYQLERSHLMFTRGSYGCASYVGKVNFGKNIPQLVSLDSICFFKYGIPVHEIGHALGLWHEHQRPIRDNHVIIDNRNIFFWAYSNFMAGTLDHVQGYGVPYDFNSVMHYGPTVGSRNGMPTIRPRNELYKLNIGQREELSYLDSKVINHAYCEDKCNGKRTQRKCRNGGYQDPNDCSRCKCPDGLHGIDCTDVQPSNGNCGGSIYLNHWETYTVETPGHSKGNHYTIGTECYWLIETKPRNRIVLSFEGDFNVMCEYESCSHWVEIKSQKDMGMPGPRFCCERQPDTNIISDSGKMVVVFKSLAKPTAENDKFIGFRATIKLDINGIPSRREPASPSSSSSSSSSPSSYSRKRTAQKHTTTSKPTTTTKLTTITTTLPPTTTTTTLPPTTTTTTLPPTTSTLPTTTTPKPTTTTTTTTTTPQPTTSTTKRTTTSKITNPPPKSIAINTSSRTSHGRHRTSSTRRRVNLTDKTPKPNARITQFLSTSSSTTTTTTTPTPIEPDRWTQWSTCLGMDCKCGGCSWMIRYKLCGDSPCKGSELRSERKPCDRLCKSDDTERYWVARFYSRESINLQDYIRRGRIQRRQCKECCSGFDRIGDKCVLSVMANDYDNSYGFN